MLLIALAVVAENLGARSWPVRFLTLLILRPAEAYAWAFVADLTDFLPPLLDYPPEPGNDSDNALELAMRFRILAAILQELFLLECRHDRWTGLIDDEISLTAQFTSALLFAFDNQSPALIDTS